MASRDEVWDARSYLVTAGSDAVLIDGNGNLGPLVAHARATGSVIHAVLLTHTHEDHVAGVAELSALGMPVLAHPDAPGGFHGTNIAPGDAVRFGELEIEAIHLPGHDPAQLAYRTGGVVATGDSIYRRTVAGHAEPSEVSFAEHMTGIQERILALPPETVILPGHGPATTVADELAANPFMRLFSGADAPPRAARVPRRRAVRPLGGGARPDRARLRRRPQGTRPVSHDRTRDGARQPALHRRGAALEPMRRLSGRRRARARVPH